MAQNLDLTPLILRAPDVRDALASISKSTAETRIPDAAPHTWPVLWAALFGKSRRTMLVLVPRPEDTDTVADAISLYSPLSDQVLRWPAYDFLPYERGAIQLETTSLRLGVIEALYSVRQGAAPVIIVASVKALSEHTLSVRYFEAHRLLIRTGQQLDLPRTAQQLVTMGYRPSPLVETPGSFSRRGGILDVWSPSRTGPVRIELFGDEVESMRTFDPVTQRSEVAIENFTIVPPIELPLSNAAAALVELRSLDLAPLRPEVRSEWEQTLLELDSGGLRPTYGGLAPYFPDGTASLLDHLPSDAVVASDYEERLSLVAHALHAQAEGERGELEQIGEIPSDLRRPYLSLDDLAVSINRHQRLRPSEKTSDSPLLASVTSLGGNVERIIERLRMWVDEGRRIVVVTQQANRLVHLLAEHGLPSLSARAAVTEPPAGRITVLPGSVQEGWTSEALNTVLLGDGELWGYVEPRRTTARRRRRTHTFLSDLEPGGFVVHVDHGIARYVGNITRGTPGMEREYLLLEYASGDKLYVPVDQVDRISTYIGAGGNPSLSRLGTADWARTKRRVKRAADELAQELLTIYAARHVSRGHAYAADGALQREFEDTFPYTETEDQQRAIEEVKADMEAPRPMDRLVCGDVGYGKTEVALRAAFKAIVDGAQVAILVPTTVLALQHFETFKHRMAAFPVRVEMLSRLRSRSDHTATIEGLRSGSVDVVIGTHRLLSKDVTFRNLGLLIVDEEQRFGVRHKETLKQLRTEVDVLTLTATPIPRTLQMALVGARDMSVIETPPEDRLPIKTYVTPKSQTVVRESILREMDRGGQVFYVHNRVHDMARAARELQEVVPEARIGIGHGQMEDNQLENVMLSFVRHENDVLLSTTIIESGLDIPNANTLIVDDAVNFGLAQLYQLRGRVGRGTHRAYAYLMYREHGRITEDAQKRLDAIAEATELGAGFRIAMKDLELRGAGNFLGPEQSGQVGAVGLELYTRLLERAVQEARTGVAVPEPPAVSLDLPMQAGLPEDYITDRDARLRLYRRLADTATERDLKIIEEELRDRFGPVPDQARNLIDLIELKLLAAAAGVTSIALLEGDLVLRIAQPMTSAPRVHGAQIRVVPGQVRHKLAGTRDRWMSELRSLLVEMADAFQAKTPGAEPIVASHA
ncbi:MAG: transcription-repair coupling factor [Chloroflexota bacterium]|nr:transcription-repair coupling factor [Chloroflexota bacterium]